MEKEKKGNEFFNNFYISHKNYIKIFLKCLKGIR